MAISAKLVAELRRKTGAGMMDCKKALTETNGDVEAAIDYLRKKGMEKAAKKAGREVSEGLVVAKVSDDNKKGVLVEINCETDFVAKNEIFQNFTKKILDIAFEKEVKDAEDLLAQEVDGKKVEDMLKEMIAQLGENMKISHAATLKAGADEVVSSYIHGGGRIGVLLSVKGSVDEAKKMEVAKEMCLQVAAQAPRFVKREDVSEDVIEKEKEIYAAQLRESGKPENIIPKIVEGKMGKFYEEVCLVEQFYIRESKQRVSEYLKSVGNVEVSRFYRFELGA
jgi:elongation factor Ts